MQKKRNSSLEWRIQRAARFSFTNWICHSSGVFDARLMKSILTSKNAMLVEFYGRSFEQLGKSTFLTHGNLCALDVAHRHESVSRPHAGTPNTISFTPRWEHLAGEHFDIFVYPLADFVRPIFRLHCSRTDVGSLTKQIDKHPKSCVHTILNVRPSTWSEAFAICIQCNWNNFTHFSAMHVGNFL